ncbi:SusC/RagA family TonB-linked outer membrane protein [Chitinophaga sp. S165]|uniref:SusC/RagA family TonB-linked outer membrane protein n=1 Tax=Chitinophaga sp. S165 TaxID=2135462 RepID=UPI000D70CB91|nr:SusC/RagA family TonB-linked outer membrane protein [Chitinophaga sp. S165]PWV46169.1 TonB-linked SusC/RagA family outer membrane protein [Chitinophaga sp. S165]
MKVLATLGIVTLLLFAVLTSTAQESPLLQQRLNIRTRKMSVPDFLKWIGLQTGVSFAYPNEIINGHARVTMNETQITIQAALERIFPATQYDIRTIGHQIIIRFKKITPPHRDTLTAARIMQMNTVVVTALGINREQYSLGYAHAEIKGKELTRVRDIHPMNTLSGKIAGLDVSPVNSGAAGSTKLTLRGMRLLGGNNQPLLVIDGIPVNNTSPGQAERYGGYDLGDGTAIINPDDVETLSVLKGGASAALYGSRAANGVLLVTTRKGVRKGLEIEFTSNAVLERFNSQYDFQEVYGSGRDGMLPGNVVQARWDTQYSWGPKMNADSLVLLWNGQKVPYMKARHSKEQFFRQGFTLTNTLALSTGNEKTRLRISYTNTRNNDIVPTSGLQRHHLSARVTTRFSRRLELDARMAWLNEDVQNRPALSDNPNNVGYVLSGIAPNIDLNWLKEYKDPATGNYINWNNNTYQVNPYWAIYEQPNYSDQDRLNGFVRLKYKLCPGFSVHVRSGIDYSAFSFYELMNYSTPVNPLGAMALKDRKLWEINTDLLLSYTRQLDQFRFSVNMGITRMDYEERVRNTTAREMNIRGERGLDNFQTRMRHEMILRKRINAVYASLDIDYKRLLYLSLTGRNDWSSTLPRNHNAYFYPSASAAFQFTELIKNKQVLSFGKFRLSVAQTGTDAVQPYLLRLTYGYNPDIPSIKGYSIGGVAVDNVPFADLRPGVNYAYEGGVDLSFFKDRIHLDATWYHTRTIGQVLNAPVSTTSGYTSAVINSGKIRNEGIEIALGGTPVIHKDFSWDTRIIFSRNMNRIQSLNSLMSPYYPMAVARWGNVSVVAKKDAEYGMLTGRHFLRDTKGRLVLDGNNLPKYTTADSRLGTNQYAWTGSITNQFSYKRLSLTVLVDVKYGGNIYSMTNLLAYEKGNQKGTLEGREGWARSEQERIRAGRTPEQWTATGGLPITGIAAATGNEVTAYVNPQAYWKRLAENIPEAFVYDATFVKVRELHLDYELPQSLFNNVFREGTVSLITRNPFTLYKAVPNIDPESSYNNTTAQGLEYGSLPTRKSYGVKLFVKF